VTIAVRVDNAEMHLGLHLPQLDFDGSGLSRSRLTGAARAARDAGFGSVSANDHVLFGGPWLDGLVSLTAVVESSGDLELMTSVAVPALHHPLMLAKALVALDLLSEGRVVAGIGPGSSTADYDAVGLDFAERWQRLDEAARLLRHVLRGAQLTGPTRHYPAPSAPLSPAPFRTEGVPLWIGSWGSPAGLRRVARHGDGWLASAYNTDPATFAAGRAQLPAGMPAALVTMWTWVTEDDDEAHRRLEVLAPLLRRDPDTLREVICIGSAQRCAELVASYAEAGCERMHFWPLGDEDRQVELIAGLVAP
jgi:alkanesulfonate monooxygenase SsuD/methylene tetrahydromethanopterin reductase-like flavin-dependent oxidoreductase (luciferase family)